MKTDDVPLESENSENASEGAKEEILGLSIGSELKSAREARGLSIEEVARSLKLSGRQVLALESEEWKQLPCVAIVKGFIKNYARLLGLNYETFLPVLDRLQKEETFELKVDAGAPVDLSRQEKMARRDMFKIVSGIVILLIAMGVYFALPDSLWQDMLNTVNRVTQSETEVSENQNSESRSETSIENISEPSVNNNAVSITSTEENTAPAAVEPQIEATPVADSSPVSSTTMKFSFTQKSWVEVKDSQGNVIFSQENPAGSSKEIDGQAPFSVVIGNAKYVKLVYKGNDVDLSGMSREGVVRLTLK